MDNSIVYLIAGGITLILLFFIARLALRWIIRLFLIGIILVLALGGAAWWWFSNPTAQRENKPRPAATR